MEFSIEIHKLHLIQPVRFTNVIDLFEANPDNIYLFYGTEEIV